MAKKKKKKKKQQNNKKSFIDYLDTTLSIIANILAIITFLESL